jgi:hypothetical protein
MIDDKFFCLFSLDFYFACCKTKQKKRERRKERSACTSSSFILFDDFSFLLLLINRVHPILVYAKPHIEVKTIMINDTWQVYLVCVNRQLLFLFTLKIFKENRKQTRTSEILVFDFSHLNKHTNKIRIEIKWNTRWYRVRSIFLWKTMTTICRWLWIIQVIIEWVFSNKLTRRKKPDLFRILSVEVRIRWFMMTDSVVRSMNNRWIYWPSNHWSNKST